MVRFAPGTGSAGLGRLELFLETLCLEGGDGLIEQVVEVALEDFRQLVQREVDPMICPAVLRRVADIEIPSPCRRLKAS